MASIGSEAALRTSPCRPQGWSQVSQPDGKAKTAPAYDLRLAVTPQPSSSHERSSRGAAHGGQWEPRWGRGWSRHARRTCVHCKVGRHIFIFPILCDTQHLTPYSVSDTTVTSATKRSCARHCCARHRQNKTSPDKAAPRFSTPACYPTPARLSPLRHASCTSQPYLVLAIATSICTRLSTQSLVLLHLEANTACESILKHRESA
jgi:hypothetical protein